MCVAVLLSVFSAVLANKRVHKHKQTDSAVHLSISFENMTAKHSAGVACYVTERLQILRIMRHVEYSEKQQKKHSKQSHIAKYQASK